MSSIFRDLLKAQGDNIVQVSLLDETVGSFFEALTNMMEGIKGKGVFCYRGGVSGHGCDAKVCRTARDAGVKGVVFTDGEMKPGVSKGVAVIKTPDSKDFKDLSFFLVSFPGLKYAIVHLSSVAAGKGPTADKVPSRTVLTDTPESVSYLWGRIAESGGADHMKTHTQSVGEEASASVRRRMFYRVVGKMDASRRDAHRREFELSSLLKMLYSIYGQHSQTEFLRELGRNLVEVTGAPVGIIQSVSEESDDIIPMMMWRGYKIFLQEQIAGIPLETPGLSKKFKRRKPFRFELDEESSPFGTEDYVSQLGAKRGVAFPLLVDNKLYGALLMLFPKSASVDAWEMRFFGEIAEAISTGFKQMVLMQRVHQQAITDGLTGLYNYRYFKNQLLIEVNRARRYQLPLALVMMDIDYFKYYNDTNGHTAGDRVLMRIAKIFGKSLRRTDYLARYGGEEFVALLPETTLENAMVVAEKMREAVEKARFQNERSQPNGELTISMGVAIYGKDMKEPVDFVTAADNNLYRAKDTGRNRVCGPGR